MAIELQRKHAIKLLVDVRSAIETACPREPQKREAEETYVASAILPIVDEAVAKYKGLVVHGEGRKRCRPVPFLGHKLYPDLAIMHDSQLVLAIEAKFVSFDDPRGNLSTALGQTLIYSSAGYLAALALLIGKHGTHTTAQIAEYNDHLTVGQAAWQICSPKLTPA